MIDKLVKDVLKLASDPGVQVKKAKSNSSKSTPEEIVKGII